MPVPVANYRIAILTSDRQADADQLAQAVRERANRSGSMRIDIEVNSSTDFVHEPVGPRDPTTVIIILSAGRSTADDPDVMAAAEYCLNNFVPILPVYDPGAGKYENQIPAILHPINGTAWRPGGNAESIAEKALILAGISEEDQRIFISYRQVDGAAIADQLRESLVNERWDVFLDRFSIPPGVDFQKRLDRELADKAFVLLLETPRLAESRWVEHEISFALQRRMGFMSLTSPETSGSQLFPAIDEAWRHRLHSQDIVGTGAAARLTDHALEEAVLAIAERHAAAVSLRRQNTMLDASAEMSSLGYQVSAVDQWGLLGVKGDKREVALVTARAPEATDMRTLDSLRRRHHIRGSRTRGWVVHPTEDVDADRVSLLKWMAKRRLIRPTPLMLMAERMQG